MLVSGESGNQDKCNMDSSQAKEIEALKIEFCVEKKNSTGKVRQ